jgi:hypothetical protein
MTNQLNIVSYAYKKYVMLLKKFDILKIKTYEKTERKLCKEQEKLRKLDRKNGSKEYWASIMNKRYKFMERIGITEEETKELYLASEKKATRKWNK